jgi:hypothetical protein
MFRIMLAGEFPDDYMHLTYTELKNKNLPKVISINEKLLQYVPSGSTFEKALENARRSLTQDMYLERQKRRA